MIAPVYYGWTAIPLLPHQHDLVGARLMTPVALHLLETPGRAVRGHQHEVARPLGISEHDHFIAGKEAHASIKGVRLI